MDTVEFAKRLKKLRVESGFTQLEAARLLGFSNTALSQYESGKRTPGMNVLSALADVYHVPVSYLLSEKDEDSSALLTEKEVRQLMQIKGRSPALFMRFCTLAEAEEDLLSSLGVLLERIGHAS